jgi:deoxyribose-phosphate aldolase
MYTKQQVAATIDHATLKPNMTDREIIENARMCAENKVACMCVRPSDVALAVEQLEGSGVPVAIVVGFPHGANKPQVKALEAKIGIEEGAREVDMVMNVGKFLSGEHDYVRKDIEAVVAEAKPRGVLVKVILETCYLDDDEVAKACKIAEAAGADFVKTSTGFGEDNKHSKSATPEVVEIMKKTVGGTMKVKASGGIRDWKTAVGYLDQGCRRLGVASTVQVLSGAGPSGASSEY